MTKRKLRIGRDERGYTVTLSLEIRDGSYHKLDINLNPISQYRELSIVGDGRERPHVGISYGGQIQDTLREMVEHPHRGRTRLFYPVAQLREILDIWEAWHLNDLKAGTALQMEIVKAYFDEAGERYDYTKACEVLARYGYLVHRGYKYGTAWLVNPLPVEVEERAQALFRVSPFYEKHFQEG